MKKYKIGCIVVVGIIVSMYLACGDYTEEKNNVYEVVSSISSGNEEQHSLRLSLIVNNNEEKTEEEILDEIEKRYKSNSLGGVLFDFEEKGMANQVIVLIYESYAQMQEGELLFEGVFS